jgi:hypothetical protein
VRKAALRYFSPQATGRAICALDPADERGAKHNVAFVIRACRLTMQEKKRLPKGI